MDKRSILFLIFSVAVHRSTATDCLLKGDPCSKFDSCYSKEQQRTCSCSLECHIYGTCCQDAEKAGLMSTQFICYHRNTITPVFVKKTCADSYKGHVTNIHACLDDEIEESDIHNTRLVTSYKTKTTYFNNHCAICNNEEEDDFAFWNIEVFCPQRDVVDRKLIRKNLTYDEEKQQWGLHVGDEFLLCIVRYTPPPYITEPDHCAPNLISNCPEGYKDKEVITKCLEYYAERHLKHANMAFRNIHCAICNGVDLRELECSSGLNKHDDDIEETDFHKMVEEVFTKGRWIDKDDAQRYKCGKGFRYDPFRGRCRKFEWKNPLEENSSANLRFSLISVLIFAIFLF